MKRPRRLSGISRMVMRSLFGRRATLMYPKKKREYPPATRGLIQNDIVRCIFCGQCQRKCPTAAIVVTKPEKKWQIDSMRCCSCRRCVEVCPVSCLVICSQYWPCVTSKEEACYLLSVKAASEHAYDEEDRLPAATTPGLTEGSQLGGKRGF